jgi:methionine-rich copper-binding protein CopC
MLTTRRLIALLCAVVLTALPATTLAHAELERSEPAADAVLDAPPTQVVITFDSELDPDTSSLAITDAGGASVGAGGVDLDVADRDVLRAAVAITDDGEYDVAWTAGSIDGHVETGAFTFRVGSPVADTALPAPSPGLALMGAVILVLAATLALRQAWSRSR